MSSSDRLRPAGAAGVVRTGLLALALLALPGCTVRPLYGSSSGGDIKLGPVETGLGQVRGRVSVAPAGDRIAQVFRNALLFRFNGGEAPVRPLYDVRYTVSGTETVVSIEAGSGIPSASLYRLTVTYQVVRLRDGKQISSGTRFAIAPFDRSRQLFAASRAVIDARERASRAVAARVELAVATAIRRDIR